jgi:hypothetical protein
VWDTEVCVGAWRSLVARTVRVGEVPSSNLGAPIAFKNREYPRMRAKGHETLGVAEAVFAGIRGYSRGSGPHGDRSDPAEVSVRCARKWVGRYRAEGDLGLLDRSSAPGSITHRTSEERVAAIAALRRLRFTGPEIAETLGMALSTVSEILTRTGMGKLGRLGLEPAVRYVPDTAPGEHQLDGLAAELRRIRRFRSWHDGHPFASKPLKPLRGRQTGATPDHPAKLGRPAPLKRGAETRRVGAGDTRIGLSTYILCV